MDRLLENLLIINEDTAGLRSLHKIYVGQEKGLDPDPDDLFTALHMMEKYYQDFLEWYVHIDPERFKKELPVRRDYQKRLMEIQQALKSQDTGKQIIALDNAVNQWHIDYPVIAHLSMQAEDEDDEGYSIVGKIADILDRLGRLPKESPHAKLA